MILEFQCPPVSQFSVDKWICEYRFLIASTDEKLGACAMTLDAPSSFFVVISGLSVKMFGYFTVRICLNTRSLVMYLAMER